MKINILSRGQGRLSLIFPTPTSKSSKKPRATFWHMLGDFISKLSSFFRGRIIFPVFRPTSKKKPSPNWISKNAKHFVLPEWRHSATDQQLRLRPEKQTQFPLCLFCRMCCRVLPAGSRVPGFGQMMPTSGHWTALWGPVMGFSGFEKSNHFWLASTGNPSTAGVHHLRLLWAPINLAESVGEKKLTFLADPCEIELQSCLKSHRCLLDEFSLWSGDVLNSSFFSIKSFVNF